MVGSQINEKTRQLFQEDFASLIKTIRLVELNEIDICPAMETCYSLVQDIADTLRILDEDSYHDFILKRNEISEQNIRDKQERLQHMKSPKDELDVRTLKRTILMDHDYPKYRKLANVIKNIAFENNWFIEE